MQDQQETHKTPSHVALGIEWVVASAIGGSIVGALEAGGFEFLATLFLSGAIVGTAQGLVLRRYLSRSGWWPLASAIGWIGGVYLVSAISLSVYHLGFGEAVSNILRQPIIFAGLGIAQAFVLQRYVRQAAWWILASAVGGAIHSAVGSTVCAVTCDAVRTATSSQVATAVTYGVAWLASGILTGWVLLWLLQRPNSSRSNY